MIARAIWKGVLKIALVTIPIRVFPATESSEAISFNQLHAECKTRIGQKKWCPKCGREVPSAEIVKGYEFEHGRYVILTDADFETVRPESLRVIELTQFAPVTMLDPMYVDRTYYLAPAGPLAAEAFATMREALKTMVGIGKLAIYGREYLVAVRPRQDALMLHTLHHAGEIRSHNGVDADEASTPVVAFQVRLAKQLIAAFTKPLNLADFTDEYRAGVQQLVDAKIAGKEIVTPAMVDDLAPVSLREALTQSLQALKTRPAKGAMRRRAS